MSGWGKLGQALAGVSDADRADIEAKTINALANRDANVARARLAMSKARADSRLGDRFAEIGIDNAEAMADLERAGVNYNTLTGGMKNRQEMGFRDAGVARAVAGDWGGANAQMLGVASGPVEIPKVSGGMLLGNRLLPGGGDVSVTPVGAAQINADNARAQASLINANRPRASGGEGRGAAAPKLTEIDKLRLKSALAPITARKEMILERMSQGGRASVGAEEELKELEAAEQAVFDRFDGGGAALGERLVPMEPDDGVPVVEPGFATPETWYQDPSTGKQKMVPTPAAAPAWRSRIQKVNGKPVVTVNSPVEAKAAWAKLQPGDGLKLPNGTIKWK
jgi:hypothetical protein